MNPIKYVKEAVMELKKVQWPTKNHAVRISIITAVFVLVSAFLIAFTDILVDKIMYSMHKIETPTTIDNDSNANNTSTTLPISIDAETTGGEVISIDTEGETLPVTIETDSGEEGISVEASE